MWVKLLLVVIVAAGIVVWVSRDPLTAADRASADEVTQLVATDRSAFTGEGILVTYQASSYPIYYLLYETTSHNFVRKELRFTSERGCTASAGDLPCVLNETNPLPVPIGSHVRVSGHLDAQRIVVESIDTVPDSDGDFELLTLEEGQQGVSHGVEVRVADVYTGGGCEVMLGCYEEGIPRVSFSVRALGSQMTSTLVPGMLENLPDGVLLLLWADEAASRATFVVGHGESR